MVNFGHFHGRGDIFFGKCMIFNRNSTQLNDIRFLISGYHWKALRVEFSNNYSHWTQCQYEFNFLPVEKKVQKSLKRPKSQIFRWNSTQLKIFVDQKKKSQLVYTKRHPKKHCGQDQIHFFLFFNPTYCRRSGRRRCQPDQVNSIVLNLPRTSISSHLIFFTFFSIACDFLTKNISRVFFFFLFNQSTVYIIFAGWLMSGLLISTKRKQNTKITPSQNWFLLFNQ